MRVYLVHHGEAVPEGQDPQRPLTAKGWIEARQVARFAVERAGVRVGRIVCSEKLRAQQTAEAWRGVLTEGGVESDARLNPSADPLALANDLTRATQDILLVGHLPFLRQLAAALVCGDPTRPVLIFPTGGAICVARAADGAWSIHWMLAPDLL